ncbi:MAG: YbhB/YbcL family Raf kinase inhibitor-like protein [Saprospiraceae bacterium]
MHDSIIPNFSAKAVHFKALKISSTAFQNNEPIPQEYTCDGKDINPPLDIDDIPMEAKSLALIMDDPDAPGGTWVHWVVWNIPITHHIRENEKPGEEGLNNSDDHQYGGPCPPSGIHRYFFKVYALDTLLDLPADTRKEQLEKKMSKHIVAFGELVGLYSRDK